MANVSFHLGTSVPGTSGLTAGGIYVNSSTGGIWYATSAKARVPLGFDAPITTAGTGSAYTATVGHILSLTAGVSFVMNPHATATTTSPTLNVNSLGAKTIKRRLSNGTATTAELYAASNIYLNKPVRVTYNGTYWILEDLVKPVAADLYGTISDSQLATGISGSKINRSWIAVGDFWENCYSSIPSDCSDIWLYCSFNTTTILTHGPDTVQYSNFIVHNVHVPGFTSTETFHTCSPAKAGQFGTFTPIRNTRGTSGYDTFWDITCNVETGWMSIWGIMQNGDSTSTLTTSTYSKLASDFPPALQNCIKVIAYRY